MKLSPRSLLIRLSSHKELTVFAAQLLLVASANAQSQLPGLAPTQVGNVPGFVTYVMCQIAYVMFLLLIPLSVVFVLIAAYEYLTSGGDENKVSDATKKITYAAVAITVALLAKAFPYVVANVISPAGVQTQVIGC